MTISELHDGFDVDSVTRRKLTPTKIDTAECEFSFLRDLFDKVPVTFTNALPHEAVGYMEHIRLIGHPTATDIRHRILVNYYSEDNMLECVSYVRTQDQNDWEKPWSSNIKRGIILLPHSPHAPIKITTSEQPKELEKNNIPSAVLRFGLLRNRDNDRKAVVDFFYSIGFEGYTLLQQMKLAAQDMRFRAPKEITAPPELPSGETPKGTVLFSHHDRLRRTTLILPVVAS